MQDKIGIEELSAERCARMRDVSWHAHIPSPALQQLRLVRVPFVNFQGQDKIGSLVTTSEFANEVLSIFRKIRETAFPITSILPMVEFDGNDGRSMAANNSSCFNSRFIRNTRRLSMHAKGAAIDINPIQNPVLRDGEMRPEAGWEFRRRNNRRPGMITAKSEIVLIFANAGWGWGGRWNNPVDYHHFYRE